MRCVQLGGVLRAVKVRADIVTAALVGGNKMERTDPAVDAMVPAHRVLSGNKPGAKTVKPREQLSLFGS